jgi:hypothetical protein
MSSPLASPTSVTRFVATGETFNGYGKSDILISARGRNVFIGECLIWDGHEVLLKKMNDQLFQYAMWRDTKTALIVFSKNTTFTDVVAKMKDTVAKHPQCVRLLNDEETQAMYLFRRHDDRERQFHVTCMAFNVPKDKALAK